MPSQGEALSLRSLQCGSYMASTPSIGIQETHYGWLKDEEVVQGDRQPDWCALEHRMGQCIADWVSLAYRISCSISSGNLLGEHDLRPWSEPHIGTDRCSSSLIPDMSSSSLEFASLHPVPTESSPTQLLLAHYPKPNTLEIYMTCHIVPQTVPSHF